MFRKYIIYQIFELRHKLQEAKLCHSYEPLCCLNSSGILKKALFDLSLGPGLSWTIALSEIKIIYSDIAIHMFTTTVIETDALKNLAPLCALCFDVSNNRKFRKNVNFLPL